MQHISNGKSVTEIRQKFALLSSNTNFGDPRFARFPELSTSIGRIFSESRLARTGELPKKDRQGFTITRARREIDRGLVDRRRPVSSWAARGTNLEKERRRFASGCTRSLVVEGEPGDATVPARPPAPKLPLPLGLETIAEIKHVSAALADPWTFQNGTLVPTLLGLDR